MTALDSNSLTLFFEEFLVMLKVEKYVSSHTYDAYRRDNLQFLDFLGKKELSSAQFLKYAAHLSTLNLADRTIARKLTSVRLFYLFLYREGHCDSVPSTQGLAPKFARLLPKVISKERMEALLDAPKLWLDTASPYREMIYYRDRAILEAFYSCGLRISECLGLDMDDIHFSQRHLIVTGKRSKQRTIPMGDHLVSRLKDYLEFSRPTLSDQKSLNKVFLTLKGTPFSRSGLYNVLKSYMAKLDFPKHFSPHSIRHSFATHLLDGSASVREVQVLLGHEDISTTSIYTHVSRSSLKSAYLQAHPRK